MSQSVSSAPEHESTTEKTVVLSSHPANNESPSSAQLPVIQSSSPVTKALSTQNSSPAPVVSDIAPSILTQVSLVLGFILLLIVSGAWLIKRLGFVPTARNSDLLKVRASCTLGQRERVVLVEADGQWLVLGVTAHTITHLHTLSSPPDLDHSATHSSANKPADFRQLLQRILSSEKRGPEKNE